jgi:hypothetical protein
MKRPRSGMASFESRDREEEYHVHRLHVLSITVNFPMSTTIKESKSIAENPPRWKPSSDPASIAVAGLDTTASVTDQIDQID